jgi:hypothetical protein
MDELKPFFETLWNLVQNFVGPLGGLAVVIVGIANFFAGKIAERKLEELKSKHSKEIELYRTQLDIAKSSVARYGEQQFSAYNQLWTSLHGLKIKGNQLWERANNQNLYQLANQLKDTQETIDKNSLFIEDAHYGQLQALLKMLSEYELGKKRLIELRRQDHVEPYRIGQLVDQNGYFLEQYTQLILEIRKNFRQQLNVKIDG